MALIIARLRRIWPLLLLGGVALALMWRLLLGQIFIPLDILAHTHPWRFSYERVGVNNENNSDVVLQLYPRRAVTNAMVQQGAWPLWNPTLLTGTPLLADGQQAFFYPPSLIFLLLPLDHAFGYYALIQVGLAGIGSYLFARLIGLSKSAAIVSGITYMLSGFMLSWLQFPEFSGAMACMPWCFWSLERAIQRQHWRDWIIAGIVLAMPLLTQIQLAFYIYFALGVFGLAQYCSLPDWQARKKMLLGGLLAAPLALGLSLIQLLPQIELSAQGQRPDFGFGGTDSRSQFLLLARALLPTLQGKPRIDHVPEWGPALLQAPIVYVGLVPLGLAALALLASRHRLSSIFGLLAAIALASAASSPLIRVFFALIPPYRQFADHSRWLIVWSFSAALLAGLGAEWLADRAALSTFDRPRTRLINRIATGLIAGCLIVWLWQHLNLFTPASRYGTYITLMRQQALGESAIILLLGGLALLGLFVRRIPRSLAWAVLWLAITLDLGWFGGNYNTFIDPQQLQPTADLQRELAATAPNPPSVLYPPTRQVAYLLQQPQPFRILGGEQGSLRPNVAGTFGLEDIRGYHSIYFARYNRLTRLIDDKDFTQLSEGFGSLHAYFTSAYAQRRILNMLNVQYLVFAPGSTNPPLYAPLELVHKSDEGAIYRNPNALPRAWLVHRAEVLADDTQQLERIADPTFDPATTVIVPEALGPLAEPAQPEPPPQVTYGPNQAVVQTTVAAPAFLVLADAYAPGWQVTINGVAAPLVRANYAFRGVLLAPGSHTVIFSYRPQSFVIGAAMSLSTLILALGGIWLDQRRKPATKNQQLAKVASAQ